MVSSKLESQIQNVDRYVQAERKYEGIPGLAVGVLDHGKTLKATGYGDADVGLTIPVDSRTVFNSGSMAKQFVAAGIMLLVQDGKLNLKDSVTQYLKGAPASWKAVRIENLLSHTSGLAGVYLEVRRKLHDD